MKPTDEANKPADVIRNPDVIKTPLEAASVCLRPGEVTLKDLPPLSLYVHFPWCVKKCPYCDFNSHQVNGSFPEEEYIEALRRDLENALPLVWGRPVNTVFIGGGTPSLMSAAGLDRLLSHIRTLLPLDDDAEITMEANPGTFEADKFKSYRDSGINRLSIGIQSFNSVHLRLLGRVHDGDEARRAIEIAQANFENFNLDLMYALPAQKLADAHKDVMEAISYAPPHLSLYHLTIEPNTVFAAHPPVLPDDDLSADIQDMIEKETAAAGYMRYEVSAYAKGKKQRARHNLNYWQFGDYIGIGAGAHSKISFLHRVIRQVRYKQPTSYLQHMKEGNGVCEETELGKDQLVFEFMLNALRLTGGFTPKQFADGTGMTLAAIEKELNQAVEKGLLQRKPTVLKPTELGRRFLNDLQQIFLKDK
ncbi:MAG TPA: radical SAM family heme chaperone HemW [Burkholderiaceae bacterium]|nr:radical SAM family heme chaperone HemW [Burkholderiaceae bacterium]